MWFFFKFSLLTLGVKCNFFNLIGHLQVLSNHILADHLFTIPWNMYMEFKLQTSFFDPYLTPGIKTFKNNCISTRYTQSYPIVSFVYYLKCRWSSSYKPYKTENGIVRPSYDPRGQNANSDVVHLQDMPNHILAYQLSTPANVHVV